MKSDMRKILLIVVMVAAFLLPAMAQSYGTQSSTDRQHSVSAPASGFRSTSTMQGSGSTYTPNPGLESNGTAAAPAAAKAPGGPHRAPDPVSSDEWWELPENKDEKGLDAPVGDAVLPLTLLACAYLIIRVARRRKEVE